ncbi:MAG: hypothetical protein CMI09_01660 [Oceanospirillaceae bacterium]|nr:hypothetical protein [Oceanospirillaceae bacterium]
MVAERSHLKFAQLALIPGEIKKILELVKRALAAFVLERIPHDSIVFEIRPYVARPDSGSDQEWLATLEASPSLLPECRAELHALACHVLSRISCDSADMLSKSIGDAQSQQFDGVECINESIEKYIKTNGGKSLQQMFSVSADLNSSDPIIISGHVAEPEPREFESEDISGTGKVDGFRESRNEVHLLPVLNHQIAGSSLTFRCSDASCYRVLAEAHFNQQQVRYTARTAPTSKGGGVENELLAVEIIHDEPFELE